MFDLVKMVWSRGLKMLQICRRCSESFRAKDAAKVLTPPSCWNFCSVACIEAWHTSYGRIYARCTECDTAVRIVCPEFLVGGTYVGSVPFCSDDCREIWEVHEACKIFALPSYRK